MACQVHISPSFEALSDALWGHIQRPVDPFLSPVVFVPSLSCSLSLRERWIAKQNILMNVDFFFLEKGLRAIIQRERPWAFVNKEYLQHRILSEFLTRGDALLRGEAREFVFLREGLPQGELPRDMDEARLFQLSSILAEHFDNYDLHRFGRAEFQKRLDADPLQSALYRAVEERVHAENIRQRNEAASPLAAERFFLREFVSPPRLADREGLPDAEGGWGLDGRRRDALAAYGLHLFAFTALSPLHVRVLSKICRMAGCDFHLWHLSPILESAEPDEPAGCDPQPRVTERGGSQNSRAQPRAKDAPSVAQCGPWQGEEQAEGCSATLPSVAQGGDIWQKWTRASCSLLRTLEREAGGIVLAGPPDALERGVFPPQIRIVGAPGILREIEFAGNSILWRLKQDPGLTTDDFAILMPDPAPYLAYIEMVFSGRAAVGAFPAIPYSLAGVQSGTRSLWLDALRAILRLGSEISNGFSRGAILPVLANDRVLAACGADASDLGVWLSWMERLGVFGGEVLSPELPPHSWARALARLRLGRVMRLGGMGRWQGISPYQDAETGERAHLGYLGALLEALWEELAGISELRLTGEEWIKKITLLIGRFIALPENRSSPEYASEESVSKSFMRELASLADLPPCGFALLRTLIDSISVCVLTKPGRKGRAGVRIASLAEAHSCPAEYVYILGMNEGVYPQLRRQKDLDLRRRDIEAYPADIDESDRQRMIFVMALLSARRGAYISYIDKDIIQDCALYPSPLILEMLSLAPDPEDLPRLSLPLAGWIGTLQERYPDVFATHCSIDAALANDPALTDIMPHDGRSKSNDRGRMGGPREAAGGPAERFSLFEIARYICSPADGALAHFLRQQENSLQNIARRPSEPFLPEDAEYMPQGAIRENAIRSWLLSGGRHEPENFLSEYFNKEFRAWWEERGTIPAGIYADGYWERLLEGLRDALSRTAGLPGRIAACADTLHAPFVFGRLAHDPPEDARGGLLAPPLYRDPLGAAYEVSGEIPLLWREGGEVCFFAYSGAPLKKGRLNISGNRFAHLLGQILAFIPSFAEHFSFPRGGAVRIFCADGSQYAFTLDERHENAFRAAHRALACRDPADFFLAPLEALAACARSARGITRDALLMELQDQLAASLDGRHTPMSMLRASLPPVPPDRELRLWYDTMVKPFLELFSSDDDDDNGEALP